MNKKDEKFKEAWNALEYRDINPRKKTSWRFILLASAVMLAFFVYYWWVGTA